MEYFMTRVVGLPPEFVAYARNAPFCEAQDDLAHTLAYDATVRDVSSLPDVRAATVTATTLVLAVGSSIPIMLE